MPDQNIKVAVRVRPFNGRETKLKSTCCLQMMDEHTVIEHPTIQGHNKTFSFDYSYWSFDDSSSSFATNESIYQDVGRDCLNGAFDGYNVSIFAYGQTGAGKSFSMVGYGEDRGIIPRLCDDMFHRLEDRHEFDSFKVQVSMLEIYNERIRDLLQPKSVDLKVRETADRKGFDVVDLTWKPANSYAQIEQLMDEGTKNRTVGSTAMNATSSRAHTIFSIRLEVSKVDSAVTHSTKIALVDLAGSERAKSTGAKGTRLQEGANINKSLSVLGTVISTLAEQSKKTKKGKSVRVPYRDSKLTMLLKESLGGNAKTVMIAALSPSSECYEETMSTLRFAARVKNIKKQVKINIDPKQAQVKELQSQIKKLTEELSNVKSRRKSLTVQAHVQELQKQLEQNEEYFLKKEEEWMEKLRESEQEAAERTAKVAEMANRREAEPHLVNLHEDPQLSEVIQFFIPSGTIRVCRQDAQPPPEDADLVIDGLKIEREHCRLSFEENRVTVKPSSGASVFVNGKLVEEDTELHNNDRLVFGVGHIFRCHVPWEKNDEEAKDGGAPSSSVKYDWKYAQRELSAAMMATLSVNATSSASDDGGMSGEALTGKERERIKLEENLLQAVQMVRQANGICDELAQNVNFSVRLQSIQRFATDGKRHQEAQVIIHAMDFTSSNEGMFTMDEFESRFFSLQDTHSMWINQQRKVDGLDTRVFHIAAQHQSIGIARVYLKPLYHMFSFAEELPVINYSGEQEGNIFVSVRLVAHDEYEQEIDHQVDEDGLPVYGIESMDYLKGNLLKLSIEIQSGSVPLRLSCETHCKFRFYNDDEAHSTCHISSSSPKWNYLETIEIGSLTDDLIGYFENGVLEIEVFGLRPTDDELEMIRRADSDNMPENDEAVLEQLYEIASYLDFESGESVELDDVLDEIVSLKKKISKLEKQLKKAKAEQKQAAASSAAAPSNTVQSLSVVPDSSNPMEDFRPTPVNTKDEGDGCCSIL